MQNHTDIFLFCFPIACLLTLVKQNQEKYRIYEPKLKKWIYTEPWLFTTSDCGAHWTLLSLKEEINLIERCIMGSISSSSLEAGKQKHTLDVCSLQTFQLQLPKPQNTLLSLRLEFEEIFPSKQHDKLFHYINSLLLKGKVSCEHLPQKRAAQMPGDPQSRGDLSSLPYSRETWSLSWPCNGGKIILDSQ